MIVGIYRIVLVLPQNASLKGKRSVVRKVLDRTRARFNVTAAEVGYLDDYRRALLGFAVVSNDGRHANAMLDTIARSIDAISPAMVAQRSLEVIQVGEMDLAAIDTQLDLDRPWLDAREDDPRFGREDEDEGGARD